MHCYPPMFPEMPDCRRPPCPPRPPHPCWIDSLIPANVNATVLGIDECGGIIVRIERCVPDCPCRHPRR